MPRLFTSLVIVLIVLGAVLHGRATQRWSSLAPTESKVERLHEIVIAHADFESQVIPSDLEIKERSRVTCRQYVSDVTKQSIVISVTTGIPGAVATHTPDVCYVGSGYRMTEPIRRRTIALPTGAQATYYVAEFEKKRATGVDRQRVRWAWTTDGTWDAPDSPRLRYVRSGELAKVYVVTPATGANEDDSPAVAAFTAAAFAQWSTRLTER
jgi:hypothetical protein